MNIFIAKLNPSTTSKDLQKLFAHYGFVTTVKVIIDHFTGRSKGYGFVEMPNNQEANEAIKELDNAPFQEYIITVKNSQPASYRISDNKAESHSNSTYSTRVGDRQEYNRNTTSNIKLKREIPSNRHFGYRGSGYRSFDQY